MVHLVQNLKFFSKFEVQIRGSVVIPPKLGRSSKFGRSKFSRWWSSPTELPIFFHIFLSTLNIFQSLKFRFEVQSSSFPQVGSLEVRSNDPTWGWWRLNFENVRWPPQLRIRPPTWKFINDVIIYEAVEYFRVQSFSVQIRCLVFRRSVPFGVWSFGVQSFDVGSLFGLGSNLVFGHSAFGLRGSVFRHSVGESTVEPDFWPTDFSIRSTLLGPRFKSYNLFVFCFNSVELFNIEV